MGISPLTATVEKFAATAQAFSEADLDCAWAWKGYDEGVRFAFFRICEQLSALAARLEVERADSDHPFTVAQRILGQYHRAYRDLQAVLLGLTDEQAGRAPAEGIWSVRQALAHIVDAERGFLTVNTLGLDAIRKGQSGPVEITEEVWNNFWADAPFADLAKTGSLSQIQAYHAALHRRILREFATLTGVELGLPISYWEPEPFPLEFRLGRFGSHMRQHTIQIEKTRLALGLIPSETHRLLGSIYQALAAIEATTLGDEPFGLDRQAQTAAEIDQLSAEISQVVQDQVK
jgi:hypothetical protein